MNSFMVDVTDYADVAEGDEVVMYGRDGHNNEITQLELEEVAGMIGVGVKAQDSPTPIAVLGAELLESTGQNNVFDALKDVLPSFSASAMNEDMASMVRSARLRGMSPGEVRRRTRFLYRWRTSSYSGFAPVDASNSSRDAEAAYVDLSAKILPNWLVDRLPPGKAAFSF